MEAGHPVPDQNSYRAAEAALAMVRNRRPEDRVVFLVSGGGSALFEKPLIDEKEMEEITSGLLKSGASITQMNTVRKHISAVKGGRFAKAAAPATVYAIILSDILGDPVDMIAGGPACADPTTSEDAMDVLKRYHISTSERVYEVIKEETPKKLDNVKTTVSGSVRYLTQSAKEACEELGYETVLLTSDLDCEASEAGRFLGAIAKSAAGNLAESTEGVKTKESVPGEMKAKGPKAYIAGGETVVHVRGKGKGGRNQEIALSAALEIAGLNACVFSVGSDGTDGPTDAAGGYVDGTTMERFAAKGIDAEKELADNNAYPTLKAVDGLICTGPTGTNVNDVAVLLIR